MFDDIVKAMTIKVTADDLTGGAWSDIGKAAKGLMDLATPFNQAWELSNKVLDGVAAAMDKPIQWLSEGGEFSEAQAGLDGLAKAAGVNGQAMLDMVRDFSDGSLGIIQATKATSDAIRMGYSEEQLKPIWSFAQKYVDTFGGSVLDVATSIENAFFTGKGKGVKTFGISLEEGTLFTDLVKQLDTLKSKLGDGAFNFGEETEKMKTSFSDAAGVIKRELNDLVGEEGFSKIGDELRYQLSTVEDLAPEIATGIFRPIMDAIDIGSSLLSEFFGFFGDLTGMAFSETDTLGMKIMTVISGIGNTGYDVIEYLIDGMNYAIEPINAITKGLFAAQTALLEFQLSAKKSVFGAPEDEIKRLEMAISESKILAKSGIFTIDKSGIESRQKAFNDEMMKVSDATKKITNEHKDVAVGVKKAGETFDEAMKKEAKAKEKAKSATSELVNSNKELTKSYLEMGKSVASSTKSVSDIVSEEQKAISKTEGVLADIFSGDYDFQKDFAKTTELESLLDRQEAAKKRTEDILERQINAQVKLAEAMTSYSTSEKVVRFEAPNDPNPLEALIALVIEMLVRQAREEGTAVQA